MAGPDTLISDPPVRDSFAKPVVEKPAPVLEPVTLFDRDNKPVQVAPHEAPGKILSGEFGYAPGTLVPISINGQIGTVPAENLKMLSGTSAKTVSGHEFAQAKLQRDYGDFAHQAETYAVNTLDSATLGASNFVAGGLGGKEVREHLRKINEANPNAAIAGQLTGIVAPIAADVLTGGAATPIVGADIAATIARLGLKGEQAIEAARLLAQGGKAIGAAEELSGAARLGLKGAETTRAAEAILGTERALPQILGAGADLGRGVEAAEAARLAAPAIAEGAGLGERALGVAKGLPRNVFLGPTEAVSKIGATVERGIQGIVGTEATTFAAKLAQKALPAVGKGMAEGALYGAGSQAGQEAIQENPDYFGEKMLHAIGYGALMGGGFSAGSTALGALGKKALGSLADRFAEKSDGLVLKALDQEGKFTKAVDELPGGASSLRQTLIGNKLVSAGDRIQDIAPKVSAARAAQEAAMPAFYAKLDSLGEALAFGGTPIRQGPTVSSVEKVIVDALTPARGGKLEALADPGMASMEKIRDGALSDLRAHAGLEEVAAHTVGGPTVQRTERSKEEIAEYIRKNIQDPDVQKFINNPSAKAIPDSVKYESKVSAAKAGGEEKVVADPRMTFSQASEFSNRIRTLAAEAASPKLRATLKELSYALSSQVEAEAAEKYFARGKARGNFLDGIAAALGEPNPPQALAKLESSADMLAYGKNLLALKQLRVADEMATAALEKAPAGGPGSIGEKILQTGVAGHFAGKALTGAGLAGALAPQAAALYMGKLAYDAGKKVLAERGASTGASMLDKLSVLGGAVEAAGRIEKDISASVDKIFERRAGAKAATAEAPAALLGKDLRTKYEKAVDEVLGYAANEGALDHIRATAGQLAPYSQYAADAFERAALRTTTYLVNQMPKPKVPAGSMFPGADQHAASDAEMAKWLRVYDVAHDPRVLLKNLSRGVAPTQAEVDAFWITNPAMAQHVANEMETKAKGAEHKPDFATQQGIAAVSKRGKAVNEVTLNALKSSWGGGDEAKGAGKGVFGGGQPGLSKPLNVAGTMGHGPKRSY